MPRRVAGSINHLCMNMDGFNPDAVIKALESYGIKPRGECAGPARDRWSTTSACEWRIAAGAREGTPELYFTDPDGLLIQIQDTKYCGGGAGVSRRRCGSGAVERQWIHAGAGWIVGHAAAHFGTAIAEHPETVIAKHPGNRDHPAR